MKSELSQSCGQLSTIKRTFCFSLPWPKPALSPNKKSHWTVKHRHQREYKSTCFLYACQQKTQPFYDALHGVHNIELVILFRPPDERRYDIDNMIASIKYGIDGICLAIGIDDFYISKISASMERKNTTKGGQVLLEVIA